MRLLVKPGEFPAKFLVSLSALRMSSNMSRRKKKFFYIYFFQNIREFLMRSKILKKGEIPIFLAYPRLSLKLLERLPPQTPRAKMLHPYSLHPRVLALHPFLEPDFLLGTRPPSLDKVLATVARKSFDFPLYSKGTSFVMSPRRTTLGALPLPGNVKRSDLCRMQVCHLPPV